MAFDSTAAIEYVRALSSLLGNVTDDEVKKALDVHAVPRIKLILLSSTGTDGTHVFYDSIQDMSDSSKAANAETLVDAVFSEAIVASGLRRVACALAASWLINSSVGIIESQQKIAYSLEKMALADLDRICKSPVLASAVSSAKQSTTDLGVPVFLMIAQAPKDDQFSVDDAILINPDTPKLETYPGAQLPSASADNPGRISMNINGQTISAQLEENDTPAKALRRLVNAFDAFDPVLKPNINLGITEVATKTNYRFVTYENIDGDNVIKKFSYISGGAKLVALPKNYDKSVDVAVITVYLESFDDDNVYQPGVKGFIYGLSEDISQLTKEGPHTIAVDLKTGLGTKVSEEGTTANKVTSDTFLFQGESYKPDVLRYQVNDNPVRTVNVPAGSDADMVAQLFAQDMASQAQVQKVLAAVRPITKITPFSLGLDIASEKYNAVCVEMVGIPIEVHQAKYVVTVLQVPEEIFFAVSPLSIAATAVFDEKPKSAIVSATVGNVSRTVNESSGSGTCDVTIATHKPTPGLQKILDAFRDRRGF